MPEGAPAQPGRVSRIPGPAHAGAGGAGEDEGGEGAWGGAEEGPPLLVPSPASPEAAEERRQPGKEGEPPGERREGREGAFLACPAVSCRAGAACPHLLRHGYGGERPGRRTRLCPTAEGRRRQRRGPRRKGRPEAGVHGHTRGRALPGLAPLSMPAVAGGSCCRARGAEPGGRASSPGPGSEQRGRRCCSPPPSPGRIHTVTPEAPREVCYFIWGFYFLLACLLFLFSSSASSLRGVACVLGKVGGQRFGNRNCSG